jgi:23S rRNA pseudouridine2604 synthase
MPIVIQRFICRKLSVSNPEALILLSTGAIQINGQKALPNQTITKADEVTHNEEVLQPAFIFRYIAMYKPRGIECTTNREIENNLLEVLPESHRDLFTVGRLDKETEGLLFLTNDARFYKAIADSKSICEKEYRVTVSRSLEEKDLQTIREGMVIMGQKTRACKVEQVSDGEFTITLTQGLNRQIRRICYKLNYDIVSLVRVRIGSVELGALSDVNRYLEMEVGEVDSFLNKRE